MRWLDALLLDRVYQPFCDLLYDRVGDCIVISRECMNMAVWFTGCLTGWRLAEIVLLHQSVPDFMTMLFVASQAYLLASMLFASRQLRKHMGRTGVNPLRQLLFIPRVMLILVFSTLWCSRFMLDRTDVFGIVLGICRDISIINGLYFASCQNRPPVRQIQRHFALI